MATKKELKKAVMEINKVFGLDDPISTKTDAAMIEGLEQAVGLFEDGDVFSVGMRKTLNSLGFEIPDFVSFEDEAVKETIAEDEVAEVAEDEAVKAPVKTEKKAPVKTEKKAPVKTEKKAEKYVRTDAIIDAYNTLNKGFTKENIVLKANELYANKKNIDNIRLMNIHFSAVMLVLTKMNVIKENEKGEFVRV